MTRIALIAALMAASPALGQDKQESCEYQAQMVAAIQQARLDRVAERDVPEALGKTEQTWPENYNNAIPLMAPWVYEQKMSVIRNEDLAAAWLDLCVQQ
jgi:hypothetical protein